MAPVTKRSTAGSLLQTILGLALSWLVVFIFIAALTWAVFPHAGMEKVFPLAGAVASVIVGVFLVRRPIPSDLA